MKFKSGVLGYFKEISAQERGHQRPTGDTRLQKISNRQVPEHKTSI